MIKQELYKDSKEEKNIIFSLDIGTRSVIGIVGEYVEEKFNILACEMKEHEKRNMYDGQIHDINGVVSVCRVVKERLEQRLNIKLKRAAVAAAGRALKTTKVEFSRDIDSNIEVDTRMIKSIEMEAIQIAQKNIDDSSDADAKYYCVGYSISNYYLDNSFIESLEGHKGSNIGIEVLATFLPYTVVDSLNTVMERLNVEIINMTLEPIAAMNAAIKKNLRLLNLALVDVGAGTSDIAITKDGGITAYAMASIAGDEITEEVAKSLLLDFDTAELLKIQLSSNEKVSYTDIVGIEYELTSNEILDKIDDSIKKLAKEISEKILEYNQKPPSAIFLIGGGSQIPRLCEYLAGNLDMPLERIVVRTPQIIQNIQGLTDELIDPRFITPIGIALIAGDKLIKDFLEVQVNGKEVRLLNSKKVKVSDALAITNYNPRKLIAQRGESIRYYLNGELFIKKGEIGENAKILVNSNVTNLDYELKNGDIVTINPASKGTQPKIFLYDLIDYENMNFVAKIKVNDCIVKENIQIKDEDVIEVSKIENIDVQQEDLSVENNSSFVEERKDEVRQNELNIIVNENNMTIEYTKKNFVFIDIFDYIDIDLTKPNGKLILTINGVKADYYQQINNGDKLEAYWDHNQN